MNLSRRSWWPVTLFILTGLSLLDPPQATQAAILQSFNQLFQGDDPSESFQFEQPFDPVVPTTVRFTGYVENLSVFDETGARFLFGWGRTANNLEEVVLFPGGPEHAMGVRFPAADPVLGPVQVPLDFRVNAGYAPASVRFDVEGLGCCDYFRLVGTLTIEPTPEPSLRISQVGSAAARITWTTNSAGYVLEYATNQPATTWISISNHVATTGSSYFITVDLDAPFRVYRLRRP